MDNPLYMPKGWRAGSVRLQPTVGHQESGGTYVKGGTGFSPLSPGDFLMDEALNFLTDESGNFLTA